jgi:hypothetical protein
MFGHRSNRNQASPDYSTKSTITPPGHSGADPRSNASSVNPVNELPDTVPDMIAAVLAMAATWTKWDGRPVETDGRIMTPNKAIRRVADHTIDHLAEAQARINKHEPLIDRWHHSAKTTPTDLAPFTDDDLNEATERLNRLAQLWTITYEHLDDSTLDAPISEAMTLREIGHHAAESIAYANAIGHL